MADDLRTVGLVFKADGTIDFKKSLSGVNNALADNRNQFKLTQLSWDESTKSSVKLAEQQKFLAAQLDNSKMRTESLRIELQELESAQQPNQQAIDKTRSKLMEAEVATQKYQKQLDQTTKSIKNGTADLEDFAKKLDKVGEKSTKVGESMTKGVTAPILAIGAAAVASFSKIDSSYDDIITKTGVTGDQLEDLQSSFDHIFGTMPFEAEAVSDALGGVYQRLFVEW